MFDWFRQLFKKPVSYRYAVMVRGKLYCHTASYAEAEKWIKSQFHIADAKNKNSGRHKFLGSSSRKRWEMFRGQCRVVRLEDNTN